MPRIKVPTAVWKSQLDFLDKLGGPSAIARQLKAEAGITITPQAVSQWKVRKDIPWHFRPFLIRCAATQGVQVPRHFLGA